MKSADIRQSFLDFFADRGHQVTPSAPLIPHGDATLLFTNAGMVPFKNCFLGLEEPPSRRAASSQKCLRVSGKHNDLENVGPSPRHHTFFEMLGNFSFGDYFKEEAIRFAWELVTEVYGLKPEHLFATVFHEDDEAHDLWLKLSTLPAERVVRCGAKDNFWSMGETGPCGPCSEIMVDRNPELPAVDFHQGAESGRYLEIWNLVFMQFDRDTTGTQHPLPKPSVDTGAGLERFAAVLQAVESNYDTDLFRPLIDAAATLAGGAPYGQRGEGDTALRVIADHLRAVTFLLADGVIPSNEGRGYVLRRILRRAVRHGLSLGFDQPFLHRLVPVVGEVLGSAYPELAATQSASCHAVRAEEEKFLSTVATAARQVQEEIEQARKAGADQLAGEVAFRLYDTHGLPLELIREIAQEERFAIDEAGFDKALEEQRDRSRQATGDGQKRAAALQAALRAEGDAEATVFEGYNQLQLEGAVVRRLVQEGTDQNGRGENTDADSLAEGAEGLVIVDRTVFYAESGGQVGDTGKMTWPGGQAEVLTTTKSSGGLFLHRVKLTHGRLEKGASLSLKVDAGRRRSTERNHTATHLLHAALRQVLGAGVRQAGSLVAPDRLRFDFTYGSPLTEQQRDAVEELSNEWIRRAVATEIAETSYQEAIASGAMALFGEKYGDRVRTVSVPGFSRELCGGCHVANTGQIGPLVLTSERGVASGVRRIEALTGEGAAAWLRQRRRWLEEVEASLGTPAQRAAEEIGRLRREVKEKENELAKLRLKLVAAGSGSSPDQRDIEVAEGVRLWVREVPLAPAGELRNMADALRSKLGSGVVFLGARSDDKVTLLATVTDDLRGRLHAGKLVKAAAALVGGGGGGRADFAQAGGREPQKLGEALDAVERLVREQLG